LKYRRDIEGLRGLAVAPVVLYHAGAAWFGGGYIGVDVFFVISGYLITRVLADDVSSGWSSLVRFYDRRVRRILPAYFVVAIATTFGCLLLLPPDDLTLYGRRLISTATFASNFQFRSEMNYFAAASDLNPLLQMWSLSVEEQFYLFWPLALPLLMMTASRRVRATLVWGALILSLGLSIYLVHFKSPVAGFYQSPARAWELLAGAVIALGLAGKAPSGRTGDGLSLLGLACVAIPIVL
jgi:peptidoglycan/LPS O-acetylase OafA/YrhL